MTFPGSTCDGDGTQWHWLVVVAAAAAACFLELFGHRSHPSQCEQGDLPAPKHRGGEEERPTKGSTFKDITSQNQEKENHENIG